MIEDVTTSELRSIADHIEKLCIVAHGRYSVSIACQDCKTKATRLREHAAALDRAAGIGRKAASAVF